MESAAGRIGSWLLRRRRAQGGSEQHDTGAAGAAGTAGEPAAGGDLGVLIGADLDKFTADVNKFSAKINEPSKQEGFLLRSSSSGSTTAGASPDGAPAIFLKMFHARICSMSVERHTVEGHTKGGEDVFRDLDEIRDLEAGAEQCVHIVEDLMHEKGIRFKKSPAVEEKHAALFALRGAVGHLRTSLEQRRIAAERRIANSISVNDLRSQCNDAVTKVNKFCFRGYQDDYKQGGSNYYALPQGGKAAEGFKSLERKREELLLELKSEPLKLAKQFRSLCEEGKGLLQQESAERGFKKGTLEERRSIEEVFLNQSAEYASLLDDVANKQALVDRCESLRDKYVVAAFGH